MKMKIITFFYFIISISVFGQNKGKLENIDKEKITNVLDHFNLFAAKAEYNNYFDCFADEATFIGTDATEVWNKKEFMTWAKPYFDKGKTWKFKSLKRNITFSIDGKYAWFDELLDTQMKICRGSGVLEKTNNGWKIKQYVLSMSIPNEVVNEVVKIKSPIDEKLITELKTK